MQQEIYFFRSQQIGGNELRLKRPKLYHSYRLKITNSVGGVLKHQDESQRPCF